MPGAKGDSLLNGLNRPVNQKPPDNTSGGFFWCLRQEGPPHVGRAFLGAAGEIG